MDTVVLDFCWVSKAQGPTAACTAGARILDWRILSWHHKAQPRLPASTCLHASGHIRAEPPPQQSPAVAGWMSVLGGAALASSAPAKSTQRATRPRSRSWWALWRQTRQWMATTLPMATLLSRSKASPRLCFSVQLHAFSAHPVPVRPERQRLLSLFFPA